MPATKRHSLDTPPSARKWQAKNLLPTAHTVINDFESAAQWTPISATLADDTTHFETGTQSVHLTTGVGAAGGMKMEGLSLDFSAVEQFRIRMYFADSVNSGTGYINFWTGAGDRFEYLFLPSNLLDGWNQLVLKKSDFTAVGSPSWSSPFIKISLSIVPNAGHAGVVSYDSLTAGVAGLPGVMFMYDDGNTPGANLAHQYMLRVPGAKGTLYMITNRINQSGALTAGQIVAMDRAGWAIANHTRTHAYLNTLTEAEQEAELLGAKADLDALGLRRASGHAAYPGGYWTTETPTAMIATGMKTGRIAFARCDEVSPPCGKYFIQTILLGNTISLAQAKAHFDTAYALGKVPMFTFHKLRQPGESLEATEWYITDHNALVDYCAGKVPFLTIDEYYRLWSGPVLA